MEQDGLSMDKVVRRRWGIGIHATWIAAVVLVTAGFIYIYPSIRRWAGADRSVDSARLRLGDVVRGDLLRDVSVQGKIVAADHPTLVSPAQGLISVLAKAGDVVTKGHVMARIDSPELRNRLEQEHSVSLSMASDLDRLQITSQQSEQQNRQEVALLEMKLRASEKAMNRAYSLFKEGLGSSIDYEKAQDDLEIVRLELKHAREKIRLAKDNIAFEIKTKELQLERQRLIVQDMERKVQELAVMSPVDGLVSRVDIKDKDTVQINQTLFSVVDLSKFEVQILIPENYGSEIAMGTPAMILYEGKEYAGSVKSLSPEVEANQFKGVVIFSGGVPAGLKQNQRVDTRLLLDSRRNVVKAPRGPFLESLGGRQVYVIADGVASLKPITVGAVSVTEVEIMTGLAVGEKIILSDLTQYEGAKTILLRR